MLSKSGSIKLINEWEVLTPEGWSNFTGVKKLDNKNLLSVEFLSGKSIKCTENELFKLENDQFLEACHLQMGDKVLSKNGYEEVKSVVELNESEDVYSLENVELNNEYYTNDIVVHNCAFIDLADDIWTAVQSALNHGGGNAILLSCVTKDTLVFTDKGIREVSHFIDPDKNGGYLTEEYSVLGRDILRSGNLFHNNGRVPTKIIKSKHAELECSENHKLWAYSSKQKKFGWFKSEELSVGDYISIQYGKNIWGNLDDISKFSPTKSVKIKTPFHPKKLTNDICYLMGLYIAEGSAYKVYNKNGNFIGGSITLSCGDNLSEILNRLELKYYFDGKIHYTISNKNLIEFFEFMGFDLNKRAGDKIIPDKLLSLPKEKISHVLSGIFDGNGCSCKKTISLTSSSKKLINQVRIILNNFGILSSKFSYSDEQMNSYGNKNIFNGEIYRLEIYGSQCLKFYNDIGFRFKRKQENKKHIINFTVKDDGLCPNTLPLINKLYSLSGENTSSLEKKYNLFLNSIVNKRTKYKTNNISHEICSLMFSLFGGLLDDDEYKSWEHIVSDDIVWDEIKSIQESENETYDFSLPDTNDEMCHSVIYNGVIGHQTPNGFGNFFHKVWVESEQNLRDFNTIRLHWTLHPDYDQNWRDEQDKELGPRMAAQECDTSFVTSGNSVVDTQILEWYKENFIKDPVSKEYIDNGYWKWDQPNYSKDYIVSADVGRGDGEDFSAFHVIDIDTMEQVAEYKGKLETKQFGNFLVQVGTEWNDALLIIENSSIGWAVIQQVIDRGYKNLFYMIDDLKYVDPENQITNKINKKERKKTAGFTMSSKTRPLVISKIDLCFREKSIVIRSSRTITELYTFIWHNGKAQAANGYNDDLSMSLGIGLWVLDTALVLRNQGVELQKKALSGISKNKYESDGIYIPSRKNFHIKSDPYKFNVGKEDEDLRWLLK